MRAAARLTLATALFLTGLVAADAEPHRLAAVPSGDERINLDYQIYFGGLNVIKVDVDLALGSDGYDLETRTETVGLTGYFAPWRSRITTRGEIDDGRVEPQGYRVDAHFRGKTRRIAMDFADGEVINLVLEPPARKDPREEIPAALRRGSMDPASALLALVHAMRPEGGCSGRVPVFDGRRRYDVVVAEKGREFLPPNSYSAFVGEAVRCDFHVEPLVVDSAEHRRRFRSGRAWFAEVLPGRPVVPVRVEVDGDYVQTLVHLSDRPAIIANR